MTTANLCTYIALFVTLLIVGLMVWLKGEFAELAKETESVDFYAKLFSYAANMDQVGQPKRRKYRDNPQRGE